MDGLDLVEEEDQCTHMVGMDDELDPQDRLGEWATCTLHLAAAECLSKECSIYWLGGSDVVFSSGSAFLVCVDVFRFDPDFVANEEKYRQLRAEILGESSGSEGGSSGEESESEDSEDEQRTIEIQDETQLSVMALRRTIYLTVMSSLDFEECAHKLLKMKMKEGQEVRVCVSHDCHMTSM